MSEGILGVKSKTVESKTMWMEFHLYEKISEFVIILRG